MNRVLASVTMRLLLGRRRTLLLAAAMLLPVVIAVAYRLSEDYGTEPVDEVAVGVVTALILTLLLPLVAVVLGSSALGTEMDDGTAVFLLTTPVERWRIIVVKVAVAAAATALLCTPSTVATAWVLRGSPGADGVVPGLALSTVVAGLLYCAVFVALSTVSSRSLVVGLIYVFVWEGFATNAFGALKWLSIREYAEGWAGALITIRDRSAWDPGLDVASAVIGSLVVLGLATWLGTRSLQRYEVQERV